jgi:hypothetical protein
MDSNRRSVLVALKRWKFSGWSALAIALLFFAAGSLLTHWMHVKQVKADSNRVFELMVYHTIPGKVPELESIFRDLSKLMAKHNLDVIGYWVPTDNSDWKDTFIYVVAHPSLEQGKKNWDALHSDPEFLPYRKAAVPLVDKEGDKYRVDEVFMRPSDFSALR